MYEGGGGGGRLAGKEMALVKHLAHVTWPKLHPTPIFLSCSLERNLDMRWMNFFTWSPSSESSLPQTPACPQMTLPPLRSLKKSSFFSRSLFLLTRPQLLWTQAGGGGLSCRPWSLVTSWPPSTLLSLRQPLASLSFLPSQCNSQVAQLFLPCPLHHQSLPLPHTENPLRGPNWSSTYITSPD